MGVDEGRKRVILIAACILAARKLSQWDGRNSPASESAMFDAIALAERIMAKIDLRCRKDESAMMRWQQFVDAYDWKARLIPTAIILLPSFSTIFYFYPRIMSNPLQLAGSSLLAFALIYLASMFFRHLGVRYARRFWEERGGLSSTRFGRMRDSFLSRDQKNRIQIEVLNRFGIKLMSLEEECERPALADRRIMDAFREIKEFLRRRDGCGLVDKHGAEYGFVRNLCGSRMIFVVQSVGGIIMCGSKITGLIGLSRVAVGRMLSYSRSGCLSPGLLSLEC